MVVWYFDCQINIALILLLLESLCLISFLCKLDTERECKDETLFDSSSGYDSLDLLTCCWPWRNENEA